MRKQPSRTATSSHARGENRVRIIGGRWRGRKIRFPDGEGLRPTGDRIRETLFNWLQPLLPGSDCLDLFAGSGVLGFEALSRGAASCVLVENNPQALRCLHESGQLLATADARIVSADAMQWLASAEGCFDIVFIDPPFADLSLAPARLVELMQERQLLSGTVAVYVEQPADRPVILPDGFVVHRQQRAGQVCYSLWRRAENTL